MILSFLWYGEPWSCDARCAQPKIDFSYARNNIRNPIRNPHTMQPAATAPDQPECIICLDITPNIIQNTGCSCKYAYHAECNNMTVNPNQCTLCKKIKVFLPPDEDPRPPEATAPPAAAVPPPRPPPYPITACCCLLTIFTISSVPVLAYVLTSWN